MARLIVAYKDDVLNREPMRHVVLVDNRLDIMHLDTMIEVGAQWIGDFHQNDDIVMLDLEPAEQDALDVHLAMLARKELIDEQIKKGLATPEAIKNFMERG